MALATMNSSTGPSVVVVPKANLWTSKLYTGVASTNAEHLIEVVSLVQPNKSSTGWLWLFG